MLCCCVYSDTERCPLGVFIVGEHGWKLEGIHARALHAYYFVEQSCGQSWVALSFDVYNRCGSFLRSVRTLAESPSVV
eukprot:scaffold39837_cov59-Attheya_sp.AAC.4